MVQHWVYWAVLTGVGWWLLSKYLPKEVKNALSRYKSGIVTVYLLGSFFIIGSPYRLTATEFTGKVDFSRKDVSMVDRVSKDKEDLHKSLNKQKNELRKQSEEIQNEINQ